MEISYESFCRRSRHLVGGVFTQPDSADAMGSPQSSVAYDQNDSPVVSPAAANADSPDAIETEQPDVSFEDGEQLTWWCDCHHTLESARSMFANAGFPAQPSEWLEGRAEKCLHIKALEVLCREAAWLRKFGSVFDRTTARRRVTSISQAPIAEPHHTHADAPEAAVMSDRADGRLTLPDICYPWVSDNVKCDQIMPYDGIQDAVLNLNNVDLFTHEVLRGHSLSLSYTGATWTAAWNALLRTYSTLPDNDLSVMQMLANKRGRFGAAWLDYISLHEIDYKQSLSCTCPDKQGVPSRIGADGIMLGCQAALSHLQKPWAPAHDAELTPGSMHSARVLVGSKHTRKLLKRFIGRAQDVAAGLNDLESQFRERAPILQDFLAWDMSKNGSSLSSSAVRLLEVLLSLARAAYMPATMGEYKGRSKCAQKQSDVVSGNTTDWTEATEEELFFCTGHYFPAMPRQRNLQRYLS
ncbi:hypothetical protein WJX77_000269 [Trebouxia sp. C0004]